MPDPVSVPGAYRRIAAFATGSICAWRRKIIANTLLFRDIKGAKSGAPRELVVLIDSVEHFIGETIHLLPIMQDVTGLRRRIVADIGAKLNDAKLVGGNTPDQLALIEPARQHELSRIERIQNERLARHITEEQAFANRRPLVVRNISGVSQERLLPSSLGIQKSVAVVYLKDGIGGSCENRLGGEKRQSTRQYPWQSAAKLGLAQLGHHGPRGDPKEHRGILK